MIIEPFAAQVNCSIRNVDYSASFRVTVQCLPFSRYNRIPQAEAWMPERASEREEARSSVRNAM